MPEAASPIAIHPRVIEIVVDCHDPKRLATFWSALLKIDIKGEIRAGTLWFVALLPICLDGPILGFQQVPEGKVVKNRMHDERGRRWRVMADPEGNEFCLTL
jgi:hypothetical protein